MKKYIFKAICLLVAVSVVSACGNSGSKAAKQQEAAVADSIAKAEKEMKTMEKVAQLPDEPIFDIITNYGTIKIKLYSGTPKHRDNFAKLAISGFYDGLLFHRVINGFMIQGGDPLTKDPEQAAKYGTGGPGYTVPAEIKPEYNHKKGALAAARRGDAANPYRESSGSQFYLVQDEGSCAQLDGAYTVFGETIEGIKTIDKIASVATDNRDRPIDDVRITKVLLDPSCMPIQVEEEKKDSTITE